MDSQFSDSVFLNTSKYWTSLFSNCTIYNECCIGPMQWMYHTLHRIAPNVMMLSGLRSLHSSQTGFGIGWVQMLTHTTKPTKLMELDSNFLKFQRYYNQPNNRLIEFRLFYRLLHSALWNVCIRPRKGLLRFHSPK